MRPELFTIPLLGWTIKGYGLMLMIGFLSGIWLAARRAAKVKADPDLIINMGFIALIFGVIGARAFYVIHYWESSFARQPNIFWAVVNLTSGGLEFYGGVIGALPALLAYLVYKRVSVRMYVDIMAPSLMWGLAFGRMGCFLNGCCWGGVCATEDGRKALPWAVSFPYGSPAMASQWLSRQMTLPAELIYVGAAGEASPIPRDLMFMSQEKLFGPVRAFEKAQEALKQARDSQADAKTIERLKSRAKRAEEALQRHKANLGILQTKADPFGQEAGKMTLSELSDLARTFRSLPVHPAQLYASINALLLSGLLSAVFVFRKRHGIVLCLMLILKGASRIVLENVRVDNPLDTAGLTISGALSAAMIVLGIIGIMILYRLPLRSPRAVAYVPAPMPQKQ